MLSVGGAMQGLGEMMPEQLWSTTLDPQHRTLRRLTLGDAAEAAQLFSVLMGNQVRPPTPGLPWPICASSTGLSEAVSIYDG